MKGKKREEILDTCRALVDVQENISSNYVKALIETIDNQREALKQEHKLYIRSENNYLDERIKHARLKRKQKQKLDKEKCAGKYTGKKVKIPGGLELLLKH